ncbi:hypothetical protein MBLNU457_4904t1 [Dothideomycetes sp. NU457]
MAARILPSLTATRAFVRPSPVNLARNIRNFQTTAQRFETPTAALPVRKPVGGFRGSIFGFLLGATTSGAALYYYVIDEYKVSNELLTEDIYGLQAAVSRMEAYVQGLESRISAGQKSQ